jgi:asparagine synthase (glutamine-hydrolysing)
MCGIAGILNYDRSRVNKEVLLDMNEAMSLRGPDDSGHYINDNCGIAMRRLSIIDLDGGKQPISNETDTIHVVLNGEIYNYLELRKDLENRGHHFSTQSDTEVLVHLYEEYGVKAVNHLNGMFAFAIWDSIKKRLWIARDRLGIKPLVYFEHSRGFAFASDLNALSHHPSFSKNIDIESLLLFFNLAYIPTPRTIWKNAKKLPPGHWILIENNQLKIEKYWQLTPLAQSKLSQEEFIDKVNESFRKSIEFRSRSDVPVGTFLSGGIDSSAITALFCQQSSKPVHTFCMDFEGKDFNEGHYARMVASRYNTTHHSYTLNLNQAIHELDELLPIMDEPLGDSAIIPSYILSKLARQENITVMLSGAGGDELFGGYRRHYPNKQDYISGKLSSIPISLWRFLGKTISRKMMHYGVLSWDKGSAYGINTSGSQLGFLDYLTNNSRYFEDAMALSKYQFSSMSVNEDKNGYSYGRMLTDIQNYLVDNVLAVADKTSMAASVEARTPFLDHNLVELAFSVHPDINIGTNGYANSKQTLKKVSENILPKEVLNRPKVGFNAPVYSWIHTGNDTIGKRLNNLKHPALTELFNSNAISQLWSNPIKRKSASESLYMIYIADKWLETHA